MDDKTKLIRKMAAEGKVRPAPTDNVKRLKEYVTRITRACAVGMGLDPDKFSCWVSDRSSVSDFDPRGEGEEVVDEFYKVVSEELGLEVERGECIIDLAKRMMN